MNLIDMCKKYKVLNDSDIEFDTKGNCNILINNQEKDYDSVERSLLDSLIGFDNEYNNDEKLSIPGNVINRILELDIEIDESLIDWDSYVRRPYYQMRGKRISEEQAFEIIRRTDNFFKSTYEISKILKDFVAIKTIDNWIIARNHIPFGYGWVHKNGIVGCNAITQTYPNMAELFTDMLNLTVNFPYIDLVVGITEFNEVPYENMDLDGFCNNIDILVQISRNKLKFIKGDKASKIYKEYVKKYEESDTSIYESDYYDRNHIIQIEDDYFKKLVEANGLTMDDIEKYVAWYIWPGRL